MSPLCELRGLTACNQTQRPSHPRSDPQHRYVLRLIFLDKQLKLHFLRRRGGPSGMHGVHQVVQFDTTKNRFLAAGDDGYIKFWDMDNTEILTQVDADGSLPVSAGNARLASAILLLFCEQSTVAVYLKSVEGSNGLNVVLRLCLVRVSWFCSGSCIGVIFRKEWQPQHQTRPNGFRVQM